MTTVKDIFGFLCEKAPLETQLSFDNAGFLCGDLNTPVTKVVTALDITDKVIEEAAGYGAELVVSHHPMCFTPIKSVTTDDLTGANSPRCFREACRLSACIPTWMPLRTA